MVVALTNIPTNPSMVTFQAYGVHMNGYTEDADGNLHLWVARRSKTKQTWPLRLDHLVAGGQPFGLGCADNLVKECQEEAGIGRELAQR
jgi:isopentenyldiphosphate isomerase